MLWDSGDDAYYGGCGKELSGGVASSFRATALCMNPNENIELLAASYLDGELVLLDPFNNQELERTRANCHSLASSPDGHLLAGNAGDGVIRIFKFETLELVCQVKSSNFYIKQIAFSSDNVRFSDIRGSHCNVWEPTALFRESLSDDSSEGTSASFVDIVSAEIAVKITAITVPVREKAIFCAKADGSVCLYDIQTGKEVRRLYRHKSPVRLVTWWSHRNILLSVDASNCIIAWHLDHTQREGWSAESEHLQSRLDCGSSIVRVVTSETFEKFILSTHQSDHLWSLGGRQEDAQVDVGRREARIWIQHQQSSPYVICLERATARVFAWDDWSELASVDLAFDPNRLRTQLKNVYFYSSGMKARMLLDLSELNGAPDTVGLQIFDEASFDVKKSSAQLTTVPLESRENEPGPLDPRDHRLINVPVAILGPVFGSQIAVLARRVAHILDIRNSNQLIFLDVDSWICSTSLDDLNRYPFSFSRHFFVPYDWFAGTRNPICVLSGRDIVFARDGDLAIIKGGLEFVERVNVE